MANTVSVSYQSIGPCIKYVCGHDGNVWDSKVFVSPAQLGDRLFQEILEQHAKYSALVSYSCSNSSYVMFLIGMLLLYNLVYNIYTTVVIAYVVAVFLLVQ